MSLRMQFGYLLAALTSVLVGTIFLVQLYVILPTFEDLERESALADVQRCTAALDREVELLSHFCRDWSAWDDLYRFASDRNPEFIESNLKEKFFEIAHVNLICILNPEHEIVWGGFHDIDTLAPLDSQELFSVLTQAQPCLNQFGSLEDSKSGLIGTSSGPLLIAARPITTSDVEGPSRGTMIFGRLCNEKAMAGLRDRTNVNVTLWDLQNKDLPNEMASLQESLVAGPMTRVVSKDEVDAFGLIRDVFGAPLLMMHAKLPRPIMAQGRVAAYFATAFMAIGGLLTMLVLAFVLRSQITEPLTKMADHAVKLTHATSSRDSKERLNLGRRDEIGVLGKEFDHLIDHLDQSRKKLSEAAHQAGMAELAGEILHNIGNAANSLNCSIAQLETRISESKINGLNRSMGLLHDHANNLEHFFLKDPRGPRLVQYLFDVNQAIQEERVENQRELARIRDTANHISEIIHAQQAFAKRTDFRQEIDLQSLVSQAIAINQQLIQAMGVRLIQSVPDLPELMLNRNKITQVLVNMIRNGLQAMQNQLPNHRLLKVQCRLVDQRDLEIEISDTGIGFDEHTQAKLFTHGFSTKTTGNGLGLHYCANAIREIGGTISATSPGPGMGATFRIRIPKVLSDGDSRYEFEPELCAAT
ncbi:MAG: HAMP domain-containing protein [Planctomycetaceae bacterium]|nr:HAMP domain-containing protein [Planctomycetaceae bacterium]